MVALLILHLFELSCRLFHVIVFLPIVMRSGRPSVTVLFLGHIYCKSGNLRENFIIAICVNRHICDA